ncbi:hypothetical protein CEP52_016793 [Fusarium oligoseptatum]|uniref:ZZ-type domain-containing protein n=1 Tax=Fusarium oligoseptatum TaxID=2604345 RepID=A0A428RZY2_9HYPO|nr:hypothetical protein CEP52_016793 [Fusarium oligoseptatum]
MSFLNKFKKEFEGLNLGERLQQQNGKWLITSLILTDKMQLNPTRISTKGKDTRIMINTRIIKDIRTIKVTTANKATVAKVTRTVTSHILGSHSMDSRVMDISRTMGSSLIPGSNLITKEDPIIIHHKHYNHSSNIDRPHLKGSLRLPSPIPTMANLELPYLIQMGLLVQHLLVGSPTGQRMIDSGVMLRPRGENKKSSSNAILAAAGGFAAGGVAGFFVKDRIDKHKAKKRHGCVPEDFADFAEYPDMKVDLVCNVCNQDISGPYAHCKKCEGGDWDVCRDCIAQGETCEGNGKHNLVKVYPKYTCDICDQMIRGDFYHCAWCNDGDWDTCQKCIDKGYTCKAPDNNTKHDLVALYIPNLKFGKGGKRKDNSSDSETDSD